MIKTQAAVAILILFLCTGNLFANPSLPLDRENEENHGIALSLPADNPVKSFFNVGKVVSITDSNDTFGISVTVLTVIDVTFKGNPVTEEIYVIYSNLKKSDVEINQVVDGQAVLGYTGGSGSRLHSDTSDLLIYIYTEKPSPLMNLYTGNQFIEEDGIFWWNPGFLIKKK